jgi:hypothetical protein
MSLRNERPFLNAPHGFPRELLTARQVLTILRALQAQDAHFFLCWLERWVPGSRKLSRPVWMKLSVLRKTQVSIGMQKILIA